MEKGDVSVLVVDYEPIVRSVVVNLLVRLLGFARVNIFEATNASQALEQLKKRKINLMITGNRLDTVVRQSLTGEELINEARKLYGQMKILMISGGGKPSLPKGVEFLQEPFGVEELKTAIKKALE